MTVLQARRLAQQKAAEEATRRTSVDAAEALDKAQHRVRTFRQEFSEGRLSKAGADQGFPEGAESVEEELEAVEEEISFAKQSLQEEREAHIAERSMLRVLASTGTMIIQFQHQLSGIV